MGSGEVLSFVEIEKYSTLLLLRAEPDLSGLGYRLRVNLVICTGKPVLKSHFSHETTDTSRATHSIGKTGASVSFRLALLFLTPSLCRDSDVRVSV